MEQEPNRLPAYAGAAEAAGRAGDPAKARAYAAKVEELTQAGDAPVAKLVQTRRLPGS